MGRFFDFVKRRIVGYIVFWGLAILFLILFYGGDPPAQAGILVILGIAFVCSLLYTGRMKRRQLAKREAEERTKQWQAWYQAQQAQYAQQMAQWQQAQQAFAQQATLQRTKGGR
jgi:hypothetical protein